MSYVLRWLVGSIGLTTLLALSLLGVALAGLSFSLASLVRGLDIWLLLRAAVPALLGGWWLAGRRIGGLLAGLLLFVTGAALTLVLVGQLSGPILQALTALVSQEDQAADRLWQLVAATETLLIRLSNWMQAFGAGEPVFDPVAAALFWTMALWLVSAWAGWAVRRRGQPLQALLPAASIHAGVLAYVGENPFPLLAPLAAALMLLPLMGHVRREQRWATQGIDFSPDIREDMALVTLPLLLALLAVAALAPLLTIEGLSSFGQRLAGRQIHETQPLGRSFGLEPRPAPASALDTLRSPGLPRSHLIGAGPELSQRLVMHISTGDLSPVSAAVIDYPPRYYWRGLSYDVYTGHGWYSSPTTTAEYAAGDPIPAAVPQSRRLVRHRIVNQQDLGGVLYATGELVTTDHDYAIAWRAPGDAFAVQVDADEYNVESLVAVVDEARLRAAGSNYPEWVRQRYLSLPDTIPARVYTLARDLTATAPTPYDRARAIEDYLRRIPYTLDVPAPPLGRDVTDYVLFDLRQGYCDYYATAMVVLARSAGIPARLAVGYAGGRYDSAGAVYVITEAEAHSWAEIYFPSYGWVEFEPTAGRPPLARTAGIGEPPGQELEPDAAYLTPRSRAWWPFLLAVPMLLALAGLAWEQIDSHRLRRLQPAEALAIIYKRLYRYGRLLAIQQQAGDTPYEFAATLATRIHELEPRVRSARALAPTADEVHWLAWLYVEAIYSSHKLNPDTQAQAIAVWRRTRWRLLLARLVRSIQSAQPMH